MKILSTTPLSFKSYQNKIATQEKQTDKQTINSTTATNSIHAYRDYNISFGERLNRTPEDFYAQKFNQDNMPDTVRKYLMEDFEERHHMPPAQLQREAFKYIGIADTVQDVKDMYGDEPLFKDLRPFSETRARRGTLFLLRWNAQISNTPIFRDTKQNKDLTLYLLKKVYLEGKTLKEINKDFESDSTYMIRKDLGIKDGQYFTYSDLDSLGISYPKLSYYKSFLATRNDKEYIPPIRKKSETTNEVDNADEIKEKRQLSQETLEKLSIAKKKWWASLSEEQRSEQIKRMIEGKELSDSVYAKYQGQIMTLAAARIGFSEKLSKIYAERYADNEFMQDFSNYTEAQRAVMEEFWNKDSSFRKYYSKTLKQTIAEFEDAYNNQDKNNKLEVLLNMALEQKNKVIEKANEKRQQKIQKQPQIQKNEDQLPETNKEEQTTVNEPKPIEQPHHVIQKPTVSEKPIEKPETEKDIIKAFRKQEINALEKFTDIFANEFLEYITKNTSLETKRYAIGINRPDAKEYLNISSDEELHEIEEKVRNMSEEINQDFNMSHTLTARTNDFVINNFVYELTGNPSVFKFERGDVSNVIAVNQNINEELRKNKPLLNKQMKSLNTPLSEKAAAEFFDGTFFPKLINFLDNGFKYYPQLEEQQRLATKKLITIAYSTSPQQIKNSSKFIGNYNAAIKFIKNPNNDQTAKDIILEHMAIDYILWLFKIKNINGPKTTILPKETKQTPQVNNKQKVKGKIDFDSISSVREAFKKFASKQNAFFSKSFGNLLINYDVKHPLATKEVLTAFLLFETGADKSIPDMDKNKIAQIANTIQDIFNKINIDFDEQYPQQTQANEFALNRTLYEITKDPEVFKNSRADDALYILENKLTDKIAQNTNAIEKRYKDYLSPLSEKDVKKYIQNYFMNDLTDVYIKGMKYHKDINDKVVKRILSHIFIGTQFATEKEKDFILTFLKRRRGIIQYISNQTLPEDVRQLLREHIVYDFIYERAKEIQKMTDK